MISLLKMSDHQKHYGIKKKFHNKIAYQKAFPSTSRFSNQASGQWLEVGAIPCDPWTRQQRARMSSSTALSRFADHKCQSAAPEKLVDGVLVGGDRMHDED